MNKKDYIKAIDMVDEFFFYIGLIVVAILMYVITK